MNAFWGNLARHPDHRGDRRSWRNAAQEIADYLDWHSRRRALTGDALARLESLFDVLTDERTCAYWENQADHPGGPCVAQ